MDLLGTASVRATSSPARAWRTPPAWSRPRAARPTVRCICRRSRTSAASSSTCTTWRRSSATRPTSPTSSPPAAMSMKDLVEVGGVPLLMKALLDGGYLHGDCITVTGRTIAENLAAVGFDGGQEVVRRPANPITSWGGVVGLKGTLAPEGAIVKVAGLPNLKFRGPARVFECEEDAMAAVQARNYQAGEVLVIRYEGPKGGPGMREMLGVDLGDLRPGHGRQGRADHRWPLLRRHARLLHRPCRAGGGGRRADRPAQGRRHHRDRRRRADLDVELWDAELAARRAAWKPRRPTTSRARCGSTPRRWARPRRGRSRIPAARPKRTSTRTFEDRSRGARARAAAPLRS